MQLPHHKNEAKWGRAAISFNLPQDLAVVMDLYISKGHKLLTEYIGLDNVCHVFVDRKGRPFLDTNLTIYWDKMLSHHVVEFADSKASSESWHQGLQADKKMVSIG